jgi:hypothetical protein
LVRADFPGGWQGDKVNKFVASGRTDRENEAFNYVKTLANYRKNTSALQTGKLTQYIPENGVYVYFRYDTKHTVMIIYNSDTTAKTLKTDRFAERMVGFGMGNNIVTGEALTTLQSIALPGKTAMVIELKK